MRDSRGPRTGPGPACPWLHDSTIPEQRVFRISEIASHATCELVQGGKGSACLPGRTAPVDSHEQAMTELAHRSALKMNWYPSSWEPNWYRPALEVSATAGAPGSALSRSAMRNPAGL